MTGDKSFVAQFKWQTRSAQHYRSSDIPLKHIKPLKHILDNKIGKLFGYWSTDFVYVTMVTVYNGRNIYCSYFICHSIMFIFIHQMYKK